MSVPTIPLYGGVVPNRVAQSPDAFTNAAVTWTDYQAVTLVPSINASINGINLTAAQIDSDKDAAAASAADAQQSQFSAASSANFIGDWAGKTGSFATGVSVRHKGAFWRSLVAIADITAAEPSVSADWAFVSGVRWTDLITSSQAVPANSQNNVQAIGADVDITLPAFAVNDFLVVHLTANSNALCRLINSSYTVRGMVYAMAGDNITFQAGSTIHLVCTQPNILEVI